MRWSLRPLLLQAASPVGLPGTPRGSAQGQGYGQRVTSLFLPTVTFSHLCLFSSLLLPLPLSLAPGPAPSPIVPAGKLDTTSTVLSSGEALKKTNFVGVLSNFALVIASPFAPGGYLPFPCRLPTADCRLPTANYQLPTANCWSVAEIPPTPLPAGPVPPTAGRRGYCHCPPPTPCPGTTLSVGDRGTNVVPAWYRIDPAGHCSLT